MFSSGLKGISSSLGSGPSGLIDSSASVKCLSTSVGKSATTLFVQYHGNEFVTSGEEIAKGAIVGYAVKSGPKGIYHWGIHVANGYVISKYDDHSLKLGRLGEGNWTRFIIIVCSENIKLAKEACRRFDADKTSKYDLTSSNCQHWVKEIANFVNAYCPEPIATTLAVIIGLSSASK